VGYLKVIAGNPFKPIFLCQALLQHCAALALCGIAVRIVGRNRNTHIKILNGQRCAKKFLFNNKKSLSSKTTGFWCDSYEQARTQVLRFERQNTF